MADEIDYDALDQALRGAIRHEKQPKTPPIKRNADKKAEEPKSKSTSQRPKPTAKPVTVKRRPAAPRGHYMDMVSSSHATNPQPRPRKTSVRHNKPRRSSASAGPSSPQTPNGLSAPPVTQAVPLVPIAYTQDGTPIVYTQPNMPQIAQPTPSPAPQAPAPSPVASPQNINLPTESAPVSDTMPNSIPTQEEPPLGTRSPYMVNTQVDKRPLGNDVKEGINQIYGQSNAPEETEEEAEPKKTKKNKNDKPEKKESNFDWKWVITMIIVVIAGAVAGYLCYILFADKLPF